MKQLRFSLNSPQTVNSNEIPKVVNVNGIQKSTSKPKVYRFPFTLKNSSSSRRKWFMGEIKWLQRATRKDFLFNGSFQEAIGPIIAMAQCFGIMPVVGIKSKSASKLHYKWNSFRTIYSFITFVLTLITALMAIWIIVTNEIKFNRMIPLAFYGSAVYGMFCFGMLARRWPEIMCKWEAVEARMPIYRTQREKRGLAHRIKMLTFIVMMSALVEHVLNLISILHFTRTCLDPNEPIKEYFRLELPQILAFIPYSPWVAVIGKFINVIATFAWSFMDLFVMIVSIGLSSRFKQINDELQQFKGKRMSEDFWALHRTQYRKMADLCATADDAISNITFLAFSNNLFFICLQLLRSIRPMQSIQHAIYFWFSLAFLISRTLALSLYSSEIYEESKRPVNILRSVPSDSWSIEVQRFSEQVVNDTIALTGMRFFFLTRKLILSVAGTIITYEYAKCSKMKQLQVLLNSSQKTNSNEIVKVENGIKKCTLKPKIHKFPFTLKNSSSSRRKWFTGEIKWLQRATRKDFLFNGSFQEAIGPVMAMAQCFGIMPVVGIKSKSATELRFKWYSFRTIYSFIAFGLTLIIAGMTTWITFSREVKFSQMIPLIFYGSAVYGMFCFGMLARRWPQIMCKWEAAEAKMPKYQTQREKRELAHRIKMLTFVVMMSSLVEHILNVISIVNYSQTCLDPDEPIKEFFRVQLSQLLTFLPYSPGIAFVGKFINVIATFTWNYMGLFVMIVSVGLSSRFKQINEELQRVKGKRMSEEFWSLRRIQYRKLADLCVVVDDAISQITLLALSNNLFFISLQLLRSIRPMPSIEHAIYFWFSLIFLISRTLALSLYSAEIYDESKKPVDILRSVPSDSWSIEVRRFCEHVVNDTVALTGMKFFFITRKLILSVAATIATYELVLIQFRTEDSSETECRSY